MIFELVVRPSLDHIALSLNTGFVVTFFRRTLSPTQNLPLESLPNSPCIQAVVGVPPLYFKG